MIGGARMPSSAVLKQVLTELVAVRDAPRVPEPNLVMDDPAQVVAFRAAGLENGVMAPVYLFHAANVSSVVRPGDTVLDLGCGPANQLAMIARLNPDTRFVGLDLSDEMLGFASERVEQDALSNVTLLRQDITRLDAFADASVDAVYSTVVLHQLPDVAAFEAVFRQVARVLRPGGGLYLVDFAHLKTERVIRYFANQYADRQPELFTRDYHNSLRAAFDLADWRRAHAAHLSGFGRCRRMVPLPYMVCVKSAIRQRLEAATRRQLKALFDRMPPWHKADYRDLDLLFRLGGLKVGWSPKD